MKLGGEGKVKEEAHPPTQNKHIHVDLLCGQRDTLRHQQYSCVSCCATNTDPAPLEWIAYDVSLSFSFEHHPPTDTLLIEEPWESVSVVLITQTGSGGWSGRDGVLFAISQVERAGGGNVPAGLRGLISPGSKQSIHTPTANMMAPCGTELIAVSSGPGLEMCLSHCLMISFICPAHGRPRTN